MLRLNYAFHINGQSDSSLKRIIPEPHVPSRGSQARGTRLTCFMHGLNRRKRPSSKSNRCKRLNLVVKIIDVKGLIVKIIDVKG